MNPTIVQVASFLVQLVTLLSILFLGAKIVNRVERDINSREERLLQVEKAIKNLEADNRMLTSIAARLEDLWKEMERMRNRLDRFLDTSGPPRPNL